MKVVLVSFILVIGAMLAGCAQTTSNSPSDAALYQPTNSTKSQQQLQQEQRIMYKVI